ncbi:MAG: putative mxaK-like protein [Gammaproteobacteria bacterium]|nr:putative mxaK-like protein [Gammaproteobacteria bacterium]
MRRAHGHLAFGIAALGFGLVTAARFVRLEHAYEVNTAIARATESDSASVLSFAVDPAEGAGAQAGSGDRAGAEAGADDGAGVKANPVAIESLPEARLARAVALSKVDYDGALAAYKAIIQADRGDLRQIALYDLGNLHLRQALKNGLDDAAQSVPLTELAKQSYRDALRKDPADWDARYNLERALRIAPEEEDESGADTGPPDPKERQRSTIADPRMDLP